MEDNATVVQQPYKVWETLPQHASLATRNRYLLDRSPILPSSTSVKEVKWQAVEAICSKVQDMHAKENSTCVEVHEDKSNE
jgi:hypothetical protein